MAEEVDKYEVLEKIGHGSFGVIRKVKRKSDGYVLCRKEISYLRMSPKEREQLQAELSILKELRHPNIVAYYEREHLKASQDLHLYMEYCGNGDLGRVIKTLKLNNQFAEEDFVWSIFAQLVTALYRCHYGENPPDVGRDVLGGGNNARPALKSKQGQYMILHRDLKPENVFLGADNSVKLGDFGLSKILQSHDFASTYVGTPFYMSPEICAAERYTLYSDIWSLGCIVYELCTKEPPFNARTHFELVQKIKAGKVAPLPPCYSGELSKIVMSCLQVFPDKRPDTAQLLNLPIVKLMRKEQEVVMLGQRMKAEKELASRKLKEADEKYARLEAEKEAMRMEIDAVVRREWEVKARLEIDRQVQLELDKLRKSFEIELGRKVEDEVAKRVEAFQQNAGGPTPPAEENVRSSTPTFDDDSGQPQPQPHPPTFKNTASTTDETDDDFPSTTDLSSLSIDDSPIVPKQTKPKKAGRAPLSRARTMFAAGNHVAASPMDIQMAEPSPMSIASRSLSPRRNGTKPATAPIPSKNIFAAAAERKWEPTIPTHFASDDDSSGDDEDDALPVLPSPTRAGAKAGADPFKVLARPGLLRQKTLPVQTRLASAPNLFSNGHPHPRTTAAQSTVPIVATSPSRLPNHRKMPSTGSPVRKAPPPPTATGAGAGQGQLGGGLKSKFRNDDMLKQAHRNNLQYQQAHHSNHGHTQQVQERTLVELAQARGIPTASGAGEVADSEAEKRPGSGSGGIKYAARVAEVAMWDPERDVEMPSPFLVRGRGAVRRS
ncbi:hypothetical protein LTR04_000792 [Oleoguttula sp. CCFEE 6159]|nr:hypothetical protein LTR04_000792 [Oleoguttula sp. CCFEE 6159]